ncbi:uncharacterized protein EV420DRAFT_345461 [Desarmillaria tabescens]|uniref:Uncharacterized protein n=1 Tax=Armillaria tabescens TaxID=1929756 RepID=A0AA39N5L9_ARMTA|nr:uncharacterized protein EV420DRAFT_345461 [Desarmillaria tabescens]KAK0459001.1 hypothetical protein EV420DRAFT_345461 [Desarmillaria tabescens]
MTTIPPELVEIIVYEFWHSEMPSSVRQSFMTTCPLVDRTWKAIYAPIASQDLYITNLASIDYLCDIAYLKNSIIYHDLIPRLTSTITCLVDLREYAKERAAKRVYRYLITLPNIRGFQALFPLVQYISFQLVWIGIGEDQSLPPFRGIPIHARYDRFLCTNVSSNECERCAGPGKTRMHIYISMIDLDPSVDTNNMVWSYVLCLMRAVGVPQFFFGLTLVSSGPYEVLVIDGIRYLRQITYIPEAQLGDWDPRDINQHLWMASQGFPRLGYFASLFYRREYKRLQSSLPAPFFSSRIREDARTNLLKRENLV